MTETNLTRPRQLLLGIEGGATRTIALLADDSGHPLLRAEMRPANLRLLSDSHLERLFRSIRRSFPRPDALGIGIAGARGEEDRGRVLKTAEKIWPKVPCAVTHDLETALAAAEYASGRSDSTRVVVLSGTGSCCFGRSPNGATAKVGGWGHLLGDKGSGYEIGLRALKAVVYYFDRDGEWSALGQRLLRALQLNEPNDLIGWAQNADKKEIAALAIQVFQAWAKRDRIARDILAGAADSLAKDGVVCAGRLAKLGQPVEFVFAGSVLLKEPRFAQWVARRLRERWPGASVAPLKVESVWGAIQLAKTKIAAAISRSPKRPGAQPESITLRSNRPVERAFQPAGSGDFRVARKSGRGSPATGLGLEGSESLRKGMSALPVTESVRVSPTEQRHPRSMELHKMPLSKAIALMLSEDARIPAAILRERPKIERAIRMIERALRRGGRLFYVGAGTSGRLGVLDASECPPTFRSDPDQVQGIMAGGQFALWNSVEGAEDDATAGAEAVRFRGVCGQDVVVGIAASGRTPFVWGALDAAKARRARTVLICFNPFLKIRRAHRPDLVVAPKIGPEVLTGSTRLKSGTATKLILNMLTTLSMVRLGKVLSNLMVDLNPSNTKLRDRAVRIVRELTGADDATARRALESADWVVKEAWRKLAQ